MSNYSQKSCNHVLYTMEICLYLIDINPFMISLFYSCVFTVFQLCIVSATIQETTW